MTRISSRGLINFQSNEETKIFSLLNNYQNENSKIGYLTFDVYEESPVFGRQPIPNATITISKHIGDGYYIAKVLTTDIAGQTNPIPMPTVDKNLSLEPFNDCCYSTYNVHIEAPGFSKSDYYDIRVFEGIITDRSVILKSLL